MLLNFSCNSYKAFRDGFQFSMIPEKRMTELNYSIISEQKEHGLSASVIYGMNAAGKTSVINAISCLRQIVLCGNIRSRALALIPCSFREGSAPIRFDVSFASDGKKYRYILTVFLGTFQKDNAERYIECEQLYINDVLILDRVKDAGRVQDTMHDNIPADVLLLTTDYFCGRELISPIRHWFENQIIIVTSQEMMRCGLDEESMESAGTLRLHFVMPMVISALKNGAVLVMDELDASIHPAVIMNLITIFHNNEVNTKGAQLIFTTHNPIYMNHKLLRRDEIKFVDRDKETKSSILYALSDFRANGTASVRKTSDYMRNYLSGRYGALEDVDFTNMIADALKADDK